MIRQIATLLAFLFLFGLTTFSQADELAKAPSPSTLSSYKLGVGDVVSIWVLGEDELTREKIRLTDAGTISFPVLGEVRVLGLTLGELQETITKGLKTSYLKNPRVSVQVDEYRPFFVNGMVEKPGGYPYQPDLTVRKAASIAGGLKERASTKGIFIIHTGDSAQKPIRVDMNAPVMPGDTVIIEQSFF